MTLEEFWNLRNTIEAGLNRDLEFGKTKPILLKAEHRDFKVYNDDTQGKVLEDMLIFNKQVNGTIKHNIVENQSGRVGYYDYTSYSVSYKVL